jgi:hypothetical protein
MAQDSWSNFGWVYGRSGSTRGTTSSSGVFLVNTGFPRQVVIGEAWEEGTGLRNSAADPAASTGLGTFAYYRFITTNPSSPTVMRLRAYRDQTLSAASAVTTSSRRQTLATSVTGLLVRWVAFGY